MIYLSAITTGDNLGMCSYVTVFRTCPLATLTSTVSGRAIVTYLLSAGDARI